VKIHNGCIVELEYELRDAEGDVVESSEESGLLTYLHGNDEIPSPIESKLENAEIGVELEITLAAGEAYGDYNPDGIVSVPRDQFPPDAEIVPGDWIEVTLQREEEPEPIILEPEAEAEAEDDDSPATGTMQMRVVEISPEAIVLDANHPLAGQVVTFDLKVVTVRAASPEEIEEHTKAEEKEED